MSIVTLGRRAWTSWTFIAILAALCGFLGILQNRWLGEIAAAERARLRSELQTQLNRLSREFDEDIAQACSALLPSNSEIEALGREEAYARRYTVWKKSREPLFSRIALAIPADDSVRLLQLDSQTAHFTPADWPAEWDGVKDQLIARITHSGRPFASSASTVIDIPRFEHAHDRPAGEAEWLLLDLNVDYVRGTLLPDLLQKYAGAGGKLDYEAQVVSVKNPSTVLFQSGTRAGHSLLTPDASVALFNIDPSALRGPRQEFSGEFGRHGPPSAGRGRTWRHPPPHEMAPTEMARGPWYSPPPREPRLPMRGPGRGRWRLSVQHQAGSLEAVAARAKWQNLAASLGILALILTTAAALARFSRREHQLAEMQMNLVAGVSHELRTPLAVIRTAAFNLRGKLAQNPAQVGRYGELIQNESEKLGALVEQVLRFSSARAGHAIRSRQPVDVPALIESSLRRPRSAPHLEVKSQIEPGLPLIPGDAEALEHALQNLVDNAVKYSGGENACIRVSARAVTDRHRPAVEIRVADGGPGIPAHERKRIFDPFFRGEKALREQVHGTGLGLALVKKIVESHGGSIRVEDGGMGGAEFILTIPAEAPA